MSTRVNIHQALRHLTDEHATAKVSGSTVGECIADLVHQFPRIEESLLDKNDKLLNYVDIFVNTESSYPEELAKPVKDGDELTITLMIAGG